MTKKNKTNEKYYKVTVKYMMNGHSSIVNDKYVQEVYNLRTLTRVEEVLKETPDMENGWIVEKRVYKGNSVRELLDYKEEYLLRKIYVKLNDKITSMYSCSLDNMLQFME